MDIGPMKHEHARQEKWDLERTVSHMYDLPQSRRRCGRSGSRYPGTWSPKLSRGFISCGTLECCLPKSSRLHFSRFDCPALGSHTC